MNDGTMTKNLIATHSNGGTPDKASALKENSLHDPAMTVHGDNSETITDTFIAVRDKVMDVKDMAFTRGGAIADQVRKFAKAHPLKAIAMAFAVGYVGMRVTRPLRWL